MSAMLLLCPGVLRGVREDAPDAWMHKPSTCRSRAAAIDLDVQSFTAQLTAEVLSQNMPICLFVMEC
eukprot:15051170-Ditylum_brightwellii.AAC.1